MIKPKEIRTAIRKAVKFILSKLQSEKVDEVEKQLFKTVISTSLNTVSKGTITLSDEQLTTISEELVTGLNKINDKMQEGLK